MERSSDQHESAASPWRTAGRVVSLVLAVPLGLIALGLLLLGGVFIWETDYSDHTGRAEAVVSSREATVTGDDTTASPTTVDILVDYEAKGQEFTSVRLDGHKLRSYHEGDRLKVAYVPGEPGDPVTAQSAKEEGPQLFLWVGTVMLAVGAVVGIIAFGLAWLGLRVLSRRRTNA